MKYISHKLKYFFLAIVLVGTIGIWLPIWVEVEQDKPIGIGSFPLNITTTFVTILFAGGMDYFLSKFKPNANTDDLKSAIFDTIISLLLLAILAFVIVKLHMKSFNIWALSLSILGLVISWRVWWVANLENPNFKSNSSLGGDVA